MNIGDLPTEELRRRLRQGSLAFTVGSFSVTLASTLSSVIDNIAQLYHAHPLADDPEFSDYIVELSRPAGPRRWYRPQVVFSHDGFVPFKPLPLAQAFAMFEWGLNWCVASTAHRFLVVHAAVVEKGGRALILPGAPGSGKSTLCAALVGRGWRLLSDEMTLIDPESGCVWPFPRPVSLKNASIDIIRRWQPGAIIGEVVRDTSKGTVAHLRPPPESVERGVESAQPAFIVCPSWKSGAGLSLQSMPRGRAFMEVAENSFNYHVLGELAFSALAETIDRCECLRLEYGALEQAVPAMESLLAGAHGH